MTLCIDHGCKGYGLGYATAWVYKDGKKLPTTKHRRVHYEATGEWPQVVRHTCDNPRCINPAHLVGGTHLDNMQDMKDRGRQGSVRGNAGLKGESNGHCKLTDAQCEWVRLVYRKGSRQFGLPALARLLGTGTSQLHRIIRGEARDTETNAVAA